MLDKARNVLNHLRGSLWLIPGVMSALAIALGYLLLFSGLDLPETDADRWWLFSGDAETAREVLSSLLTGMITMTTLVVSITMVVLSVAANQLGPRLIGNFMRDRAIQLVLGLFVGTILYVMFVLRSVTGDRADDLPHLPISLGYALSMLCLFALLFYVHKIARSIIADTVVREVADGLERAIAAARPENDGDGAAEARHGRYRQSVALGRAGYVQVVDFDSLTRLAAEADALIELHVRAGDFVLCGGEHLTVSAGQPLRDDLLDAARRAVLTGASRTPTQDLDFSVRQLVEVALRALSTGLNDQFTALTVIDRLAAALEKACTRADPLARYCDGGGRVRVLARTHDFAHLLDSAFDAIRQAGGATPAVLIRLAAAIAQLAAVVDRPRRRAALLAHLGRLERAAERHLDEPDDRARFAAAAAAARRHLLTSG